MSRLSSRIESTRWLGPSSTKRVFPVNDATVLLFASDAANWSEDSRAERAVRPDQDGQSQIKGLPAGEYLAVALDYVEDGLWNDPEYLESVRSPALRLTVGESGAQSISLKLVTP